MGSNRERAREVVWELFGPRAGEAGGFNETRSQLIDSITALLDAKDRQTAHALAQAAAQQDRAAGLERALKDLLDSACAHATPGVRAKWILDVDKALSAQRPSPSRVLEVVRAGVAYVAKWHREGDWGMCYADQDPLVEAVDRLSPEERAALGEGKSIG